MTFFGVVRVSGDACFADSFAFDAATTGHHVLEVKYCGRPQCAPEFEWAELARKKTGCFEIKAALYGSDLQELRRWKRSESGEDRVTRACTHH